MWAIQCNHRNVPRDDKLCYMNNDAAKNLDLNSSRNDDSLIGVESRTLGYIWWLPLIIAAITGALIFTVTKTHEDIYRSTAILWVPPSASVSPISYGDAITSHSVLTNVIESQRLKLTPNQLRDKIEIQQEDRIIFLHAIASRSIEARHLLTAIVSRTTNNKSPLIPDQPSLQVTREAWESVNPVHSDAARDTAIGIAISLLIGFILTALISRKKSQQQPVLPINHIVPWKLLDVLPRVTKLDTIPALNLCSGRLYRALHKEREGRGIRTLLVTGLTEGSEITTTAIKIAEIYKQSQISALLVDASMGTSELHDLIDIDNDRGYSNLLHEIDSPPLETLVKTSDSLRIMPYGSFQSGKGISPFVYQTRQAFDYLSHSADVVIVIGPTLENIPATTILANHCETTIIAINALFEDQQFLEKTVAIVEASDINIMGTIVTRASWSSSERFRNQSE